jgi:hypothetical protein
MVFDVLLHVSIVHWVKCHGDDIRQSWLAFFRRLCLDPAYAAFALGANVNNTPEPVFVNV